eukprot:3781903-Pyramimonas_sp.AAC.1
MVAPSWNHVLSRVQAPQGGHPRGYLTCLSRARTKCLNVSRLLRGICNMVVPSWHWVFLHVQATQGGHPGMYLTWLSRAGTGCFYMSGPPKRGT